MHMADALISPAVGGAMWATTGAAAAYCAKKVREDADESKIPLMGVTGAFIFAAQMLNFTIPGTGSSGHLGGGLILSVLVGPQAAFLVMASVLAVQALFFADGGLLALGANVFNLGFLPAFLAYPLVYRRIVGDAPGTGRIVAGSVLGSVIALQLGALGVVLQTTLSGVSALPLTAFLVFMLPIHLAIGIVEGLVTAGVIVFVHKAQPEILTRSATGRSLRGLRMRAVLGSLVAAAVLSGVAFAWFASTDPDGLEWSIARVTGAEDLESDLDGVHGDMASVQELTAILPDYAFPTDGRSVDGAGQDRWPAVDAGTSTSGLVGAAITLAIVGGTGLALRRRRRPER